MQLPEFSEAMAVEANRFAISAVAVEVAWLVNLSSI